MSKIVAPQVILSSLCTHTSQSKILFLYLLVVVIRVLYVKTNHHKTV